MRRALLIVLCAGCGFRITSGSNTGDGGAIDGDPTSDGTTDDADLTDGSVVDMPVDGSFQNTCILAWLNHTIAFDTATELTTINSTSYDRDPFVSADELTIWWSSGNSNSLGGGDVFKATRANLAQSFGSSARDPDFSTTGAVESKMSMTSNRMYAVVSSTEQGGAGGSDIWETSRPNTSATWGALTRTHVMALETTGSELDPFVTSDGLAIYWSPTPPTPQRIMTAKRGTTSENFGSVAEVAALNTAGANFDPTLIADDRVIVFASDRAASSTGDNIWYATRAQSNAAFGEPILLSGVSSNLDDGDPHVSADGCRIYFARNVGGGVDWQLFFATAQ